MSPLEATVRDLCDALGIVAPAPSPAARYELRLDDLVLRLTATGDNEVALEGVVLHLGPDAAKHWADQQELLRYVLTLNLARTKRQARPEMLSFDEEENTLVLWRAWPVDERLPAAVIRGAEELLNELEFWRNQLSTPASRGGGSR